MTNFRGRKFRGEFWLPAHPSIIARGELAIDKDGDVRLSLDGSGELGILIGDPSPRTVFGPIHADYGYDVTLFDAFTRYSSTRRIGAEKAISIAAELVSNGALIGHHIAGLDEPQAGKLILPIATTYKPSQIKEAIKTVSVVARFYWTFGGGAGCASQQNWRPMSQMGHRRCRPRAKLSCALGKAEISAVKNAHIISCAGSDIVRGRRFPGFKQQRHHMVSLAPNSFLMNYGKGLCNDEDNNH